MISIKIKNPLFTYYSRFFNILDFNPKKFSMGKVCDINVKLERIYYVKYDKDPFYLIIDDLKDYFKYSKEKDRKELEFIIINRVDSVNFGFSDYFRDCGNIRFDTDDTLPLDTMVSIYSTTIVIRSVYRNYYDRFYPQIHLANCIYVQSN